MVKNELHYFGYYSIIICNRCWYDSMTISLFNKLLTNIQCEGRFAFIDFEQDCLIGFFSSEQVRKLNELTNIEFKIC